MRYLVVMFLLAVTVSNGQAADLTASGIGFFKSVKGEVLLIRGEAEQKVEAGQQLFTSDTVITATQSSAAVIFQDGTRMTLGAGSELEVQKYEFQPRKEQYDFTLFLKRGSVIYSSGRLGKLAPEKVKLRTPRATVGIRGTRLLLSVK